MVFLLLVGFLAIFIEPAIQENLFSNLVKLGSLILLSPIAFFFGGEFRRRKQIEKDVDEKTAEILEDADELLHSGSKNEEDVEEINDIIEKSEELRKGIEENEEEEE